MPITEIKEKHTFLAPGNISLKIKGGVSTYKLYGFVLKDRTDEDYILLQPADLMRKPMMRIHKDKIAECIVQY